MPDSSPHSELRDKAWSRIDTTKTEDMVPASELRRWLLNYCDLFEQYGTLRLAAEAVFRSGNDAPSGMGGRYVNARDMDALGAVLYPASSPGKR